MARFAPLTNAANTPGFSRTSRRCLRRNVVCIAGSMYTMLDVNGDILFGSPTFAMPLLNKETEEQNNKKKMNDETCLNWIGYKIYLKTGVLQRRYLI